MEKFKFLRGDKTIWAMILLLAIASFCQYTAPVQIWCIRVGEGKGSTLGFLVKHLVHISIGLFIVFLAHKFHYEKYKKFSLFGIPLVILLLAYTLSQGKVIGRC